MIKRRGNRPLAVGVQLPEVERVVRWPELKSMAMRADQLGFDSVWVGDHLIYRQSEQTLGPWEAWSSLAAIAAVTENVRLGPLVAATGFHNPAMLAKKAAAIDEISEGRLVLGLGAGWNETEYRAFGFPFDHRVSRFEEAFTLIRQLLNQEVGGFRRQVLHERGVRDLTQVVQSWRTPVVDRVDGVRGYCESPCPTSNSGTLGTPGSANTPEGLRPYLEQLDEACDEVGRAPDDIDRTVTLLVRTPQGTGRNAGDSKGKDETPITGTPAEVAASIAAFAPLGIAEVQLVVDPITVESIEWCGEALAILDRTRA